MRALSPTMRAAAEMLISAGDHGHKAMRCNVTLVALERRGLAVFREDHSKGFRRDLWFAADDAEGRLAEADRPPAAKPGRLPCCVPFCRRTAAADKHPGWDEIICGKHYRTVAVKVRRFYSRVWRRIRLERERGPAEFWRRPPGSPERLRLLRLERMADRLWRRIKREAIEAAGGIG